MLTLNLHPFFILLTHLEIKYQVELFFQKGLLLSILNEMKMSFSMFALGQFHFWELFD